MKHVVLFFLLPLFATVAYSQTSIQIDSVELDLTPYTGGYDLEASVSVLVYVPAGTTVDSVRLKLGNAQGGGDLYDASVTPGSLQYEGTSGKYYYQIDVGHYPIVPPFVEAVLVSGASISNTYDKQLVY